MLNQCVPCKIIINGRLMATNADLLAETVGADHSLFKSARVLASASRAMVQAYDEAVAEGIVALPSRPWGWKGCAQATQLMQWVEAAESGELIVGEADSINSTGWAARKMREWTIEANKRTAALVSGRAA